MLQYDPRACWPSAEELPDSDDKPVDNELQVLIPSLLRAILALLWKDRQNWFFGVDMGIYYHPDTPPVVPDGFLSLEVERVFDEDLRLNYVLWEELKVPTLVLEVVSKARNKEYRQKKALYAELGMPYYVIYAPRRRRKECLEIYRLVEEQYVLLPGQPAWIEELGLGIGRERGTYEGVTREWLYWYDRDGKRYATPEERLAQAEEQVEQNRERIRALEQKLRASGIEP